MPNVQEGASNGSNEHVFIPWTNGLDIQSNSVTSMVNLSLH